jgi:hypothetical protein
MANSSSNLPAKVTAGALAKVISLVLADSPAAPFENYFPANQPIPTTCSVRAFAPTSLLS